MPPTSKTRLLLLSDTHTVHPYPSPLKETSPYRHPLPDAQILLHAGDITKVGLMSEHKEMFSLLESHPAELKIVITGNHDITLDEEYYNRVGWLRHRYRDGNGRDHLARLPAQKPPDSSSSQPGSGAGSEGGEGGLESPSAIKALWTSAAAVEKGIIYMEEEIRTFVLPSTGARFTVYASPYTPEFCAWAFAYDRDEDRFNPTPTTFPTDNNNNGSQGGDGRGKGAATPIPSYPGIDICLTHGPPFGILDQVVGSGESVGCEHLYRAVKRARPALHVFGHIHEGYGARRVEWASEDEGNETTGSGSGIKSIEEIAWDREDVLDERGAYVDLTSGSSSSSAKPLRRGHETVFVNASVVNVEYKGLNAPWVVDLDLEVDGRG